MEPQNLKTERRMTSIGLEALGKDHWTESAGIFSLPILVTIMGHLLALGFSFFTCKMMR